MFTLNKILRSVKRSPENIKRIQTSKKLTQRLHLTKSPTELFILLSSFAVEAKVKAGPHKSKLSTKDQGVMFQPPFADPKKKLYKVVAPRKSLIFSPVVNLMKLFLS